MPSIFWISFFSSFHSFKKKVFDIFIVLVFSSDILLFFYCCNISLSVSSFFHSHAVFRYFTFYLFWFSHGFTFFFCPPPLFFTIAMFHPFSSPPFFFTHRFDSPCFFFLSFNNLLIFRPFRSLVSISLFSPFPFLILAHFSLIFYLCCIFYTFLKKKRRIFVPLNFSLNPLLKTFLLPSILYIPSFLSQSCFSFLIPFSLSLFFISLKFYTWHFFTVPLVSPSNIPCSQTYSFSNINPKKKKTIFSLHHYSDTIVYSFSNIFPITFPPSIPIPPIATSSQLFLRHFFPPCLSPPPNPKTSI